MNAHGTSLATTSLSGSTGQILNGSFWILADGNGAWSFETQQISGSEGTVAMKGRQKILFLAGIVLAIGAATSLALLIVQPASRLWFYLLYAVVSVFSPTCFRICGLDRAFGAATIVIIAVAFACFVVCGLTIGPNHHGPDPVGANAMANLFELVIYPLKFVPLALPAIACWILAIAFEKWHIAIHIFLGILLSVIAIVNLNIGFNLLLNPEVLDWLLAVVLTANSA